MGYLQYTESAKGYLVSQSVKEKFRNDWFDPDFWGEQAAPVALGGRGAAWFVHAPCGELVLRHFCRGGLPGRFIRRSYIFTCADAVRSFAEFRLLHQLSEAGLPVPEPLAAGYCMRGPLLYSASLIVRRIPDAKPIAEYVSASSSEIWRAAGACVRRFHDAGVYHADLNCMNILVADQIYLIDFDRGCILPPKSESSWKESNISRLERSTKKCLQYLDSEIRETLWRSFLEGYRDSNQ